MTRIQKYPEQLSISIDLLKWTFLVLPVAITTGSAVALFLWLLDKVTTFRWQHGWLIYLLPAAGLIIFYLYALWGKNSEKGNNLVIEEIHQPGGGIPRRMAPLVLAGTLLTHLFGGSAGREGTAVQIGGSLASGFGDWWKLDDRDRRIILTAGIAAGFGAVFGTPLTGTLFAMEVLTIGRIQYNALLPCLVAGVVGDLICSAWGIHHTQYSILFQGQRGHGLLPIDLYLLVKVILAGACFGLAAFLFAGGVHVLKRWWKQIFPYPWLVPVAGGLVIIGLVYLTGTTDYLGLGVTTANGKGVSILSAFREGGATPWSWLWKLIFTIVTLSAGFKGGEVTPLFFIGATLGNTLAWLLGAPVDLFAGLGFIAIFAGATNTPLACTVMGVELFGGEFVLYFAVACFTAYFFSGHSGIYSAQKIAVPKIIDPRLPRLSAETSLEESFNRRRSFVREKWELFRKGRHEE
jgi:H+/Cl- antiporter ClcA